MPRGAPPSARPPTPSVPDPDDPVGRPVAAPLVLDDELRRALRPWIDLTEVGPLGLRSWILAILPLVPRPSPESRAVDRDESRDLPADRLAALALALAECATDRARTHFQAAEYFRENRLLARRVRALEAMLRTRASVEGAAAPPPDPEAEAATHRYLPPERG
ncbi:MAG TPA: hypothetical protein VMG36_08475 [Thermoplasmata archaeon]|nr:hypothetical protein [Thermoplasmata archaeon]